MLQKPFRMCQKFVWKINRVFFPHCNRFAFLQYCQSATVFDILHHSTHTHEKGLYLFRANKAISRLSHSLSRKVSLVSSNFILLHVVDKISNKMHHIEAMKLSYFIASIEERETDQKREAELTSVVKLARKYTQWASAWRFQTIEKEMPIWHEHMRFPCFVCFSQKFDVIKWVLDCVRKMKFGKNHKKTLRMQWKMFALKSPASKF